MENTSLVEQLQDAIYEGRDDSSVEATKARLALKMDPMALSSRVSHLQWIELVKNLIRRRCLSSRTHPGW